MAKVGVDTKVLEATVDFIEQATGFAQKQAELEAAVAQRGPQVVDTLIKNGFITEDKRESAIRATRHPVKVLESLEKTASLKAGRKVAPAPVPLGSGEDIKEAGVHDKNDVSPDMSAANSRFLRAIGF